MCPSKKVGKHHIYPFLRLSIITNDMQDHLFNYFYTYSKSIRKYKIILTEPF